MTREVEGERLVTRHILEQTRRNGDASRRASIVSRKKVDGLDRQVDLLDRTVKDQTKSLPVVLAETLSEMQRERDGR